MDVATMIAWRSGVGTEGGFAASGKHDPGRKPGGVQKI